MSPVKAPKGLKRKLPAHHVKGAILYRLRWYTFTLLIVGLFMGSIWDTPEFWKIRYMLRTGNPSVKVFNRSPF